MVEESQTEATGQWTLFSTPTDTPRVCPKMAITLDDKIMSKADKVQLSEIRTQADTILVTAVTIIADNSSSTEHRIDKQQSEAKSLYLNQLKQL